MRWAPRSSLAKTILTPESPAGPGRTAAPLPPSREGRSAARLYQTPRRRRSREPEKEKGPPRAGEVTGGGALRPVILPGPQAETRLCSPCPTWPRSPRRALLAARHGQGGGAGSRRPASSLNTDRGLDARAVITPASPFALNPRMGEGEGFGPERLGAALTNSARITAPPPPLRSLNPALLRHFGRGWPLLPHFCSSATCVTRCPNAPPVRGPASPASARPQVSDDWEQRRARASPGELSSGAVQQRASSSSAHGPSCCRRRCASRAPPPPQEGVKGRKAKVPPVEHLRCQLLQPVTLLQGFAERRAKEGKDESDCGALDLGSSFPPAPLSPSAALGRGLFAPCSAQFLSSHS